jgi:hypothetical protein
MTKYKNISGGELDLVVPGLQCHVEDGEVVDIPDFQPDGVSPIVVPPNRWEPVPEPKVRAEKAAKDDSGEGA